MLENDGKFGSVTLIDAAPALVKGKFCIRYTNNQFTDELLQKDIIQFLVSALCENSIDVDSTIKFSTWEENVEQALTLLTNQKVFGKEYLRLMMNALLNRLKIISSADIKLSSANKSKATLIRPNTPWVPDIDEKYDLQPYFKETVDLIYIDGNHFTILENPSLLGILNKIHSELEN